jgi:hypothetical protein
MLSIARARSSGRRKVGMTMLVSIIEVMGIEVIGSLRHRDRAWASIATAD